MRTRTATKGAAVTALTLMGVLALTGCGSDGGGDSGVSSGDAAKGDQAQPSSDAWTYQFDQVRVAKQSDVEPVAAESNPFTVTLSDELTKAAPSAGELTVKSYSVKTAALPSGLCRADVSVDYAPGGEKALTAGGDQKQILSSIFDTSYVDDVEIVSSLPSDDDVSSDGGEYITEDGSKFAVIDDCSDDANDSFMELAFPFAEPIKGTSDQTGSTETEDKLAYADVIVTAGGQSGSEGSTALLNGRTMLDVSASGSWKKAADDWKVVAD